MQINRVWNYMLSNAPVKEKEEQTMYKILKVHCLTLFSALECCPVENLGRGLIQIAQYLI